MRLHQVKKAETARDELKAAVEANNIEEMKTKRDALNEIVQNLTVKLYEQAAQQQAQENPEAAQGGADDVVDGLLSYHILFETKTDTSNYFSKEKAKVATLAFSRNSVN